MNVKIKATPRIICLKSFSSLRVFLASHKQHAGRTAQAVNKQLQSLMIWVWSSDPTWWKDKSDPSDLHTDDTEDGST